MHGCFSAPVLAIVLAAGLTVVIPGKAWGADMGHLTGTPALPPEWSQTTLPGAHGGVTLKALQRQALAPPARYRVVVIPGSGCTGWGPVAPRYFAGLLHAELLVLHKPGVDSLAGLTPECSSGFIQSDTLPAWRDHAQAALQAHFAPLSPMSSPTPPEAAANAASTIVPTTFASPTSSAKSVSPALSALPQLPTFLVGISEGAELLPSLAGRVPTLAGMVMISAPGLDPREAGELQAIRLGHSAAWQALAEAVTSSASDDTLREGRTLAYWRSFWQWPLAQPLLNAPWPLLRVWGEADALVPIPAYERFGQQARNRSAAWCDLRLPGADHGLASTLPDERDGLQWLWAQLENWARNPAAGLCPKPLTP